MSIITSGHLIDLLPQARSHIWAYKVSNRSARGTLFLFHRIANEGTWSLRIGMRATLPGCLWIPALPTFLHYDDIPSQRKLLLHLGRKHIPGFPTRSQVIWVTCAEKQSIQLTHLRFHRYNGGQPRTSKARTCEKPLVMQHDTKKDIILRTKFKKEFTKEPQS